MLVLHIYFTCQISRSIEHRLLGNCAVCLKLRERNRSCPIEIAIFASLCVSRSRQMPILVFAYQVFYYAYVDDDVGIWFIPNPAVSHAKRANDFGSDLQK